MILLDSHYIGFSMENMFQVMQSIKTEYYQFCGSVIISFLFFISATPTSKHGVFLGGGPSIWGEHRGPPQCPSSKKCPLNAPLKKMPSNAPQNMQYFELQMVPPQNDLLSKCPPPQWPLSKKTPCLQMLFGMERQKRRIGGSATIVARNYFCDLKYGVLAGN